MHKTQLAACELHCAHLLNEWCVKIAKNFQFDLQLN